jgi:hypothetical protein
VAKKSARDKHLRRAQNKRCHVTGFLIGKAGIQEKLISLFLFSLSLSSEL